MFVDCTRTSTVRSEVGAVQMLQHSTRQMLMATPANKLPVWEMKAAELRADTCEQYRTWTGRLYRPPILGY